MSGSYHMPLEYEPGNGDSVTSTPRFNHHQHMYDDSSAHQPRVRFMCSFGGEILLRPHDNQLRYAGGDTRIVAVNRHTNFAAFNEKLSKLVGNPNINIKYQLPNEDLDSLITVTTDEDLENMMEEYDRLTLNQKSARLRLFLFPNDSGSRASTISSILDGSTKREQWFVDALNGGLGLERRRSEASSIVSEVPDYLFGLESSEDPLRESKFMKNKILEDPGSPAPPSVSSPYCSTSSSLAPQVMTVIPDLPPVKTKLDKKNPIIESKEMPVESVSETGHKMTVQQQQPGFPGSPHWNYPRPHVQTIPIYYVPGPVHSIPMRAPYVHPFPVPPNQLPVGYPPVYNGMRPVMGVDPNEFSASSGRGVTEGMNQPVYYEVRNSGVVPGSVGENIPAPGTDGKPGRLS